LQAGDELFSLRETSYSGMIKLEYSQGSLMNALTFDSLSSARRLRDKGVPQEQAEAFADELRIASEIDISHLATREELNNFKSELKADLRELELRIDLKMSQNTVTLTKWITAVIVLQVLSPLIQNILPILHMH
jgi:DNA-binding transcriptional MerR regulator